MASTSKYGGASYTPEELADPTPPQKIRVHRAEIGYVDRKEESSATTDGGDSIPSSQKPETPEEKPKASPRQPARTTANRSKAKKESSSAPSTDGNGPETDTPPSDEFSESSGDSADDMFDDI